MKRLLLLAVLAAAVLVPMQASANYSPGLDLSQLRPSTCNPIATPLVDVTFKTYNNYDSGVHGNAWANDTILRHLQVYATYGGLCAITTDAGTFKTFAGDSPNGTGTVSANRVGSIVGGWRSGVFPGYVLATPAYPIKGYLGSFNLQCVDANTCPGAHPTIDSFVANYDGSQPWWGWQYNTVRPNQQWINAVSGNSGDITG